MIDFEETCSPAQQSYHKALTGFTLPWWVCKELARRLIQVAVDAKIRRKFYANYSGRTFALSHRQAHRRRSMRRGKA
jgi:hypothetical protein